MLLASICNFISLLLAVHITLVSQESDSISYDLVPSLLATSLPATYPKLTINNVAVFSHNINDDKNQISICRDTLFCILQTATIYTPQKSYFPAGPVVSYNYFVQDYSKNGIDLLSDETRFNIGSNEGWQYFVFKSKNSKGQFIITLFPTFSRFPEKTLKITII